MSLATAQTLVVVAGWLYVAVLTLLGVNAVQRRSVPGGLITGLFVMAILLHAAGGAVRLVVLGRPPVTNLYESFVFAALGAAVIGFYLERRYQNGLGMLVGASGGCLVHLAVMTGSVDTIDSLPPILNSHFWLMTHVVTIIAGYAAVFVTAVLGHCCLFSALGGGIGARFRTAYKVLKRSLFVAIALTFAGTILGGLWAEQSWGRFWGWDPKENGALMILLWMGMLVEMRRNRLCGTLAMCAGSAFLNLFLLWAWIGVNQLGAGLHSYGESTRSLLVLVSVSFLEILLVLGLTHLAAKREALQEIPERVSCK